MKRNTFLKSVLALPFVGGLLSFVSKPKEAVTVFTEEMLKRNNYGLFIINSKVTDVTQRPGYAATQSFKLCWTLGVCRNEIRGEYTLIEFPKYCIVDFLTDGMILPIGSTYADMLEYLNNNPYGEKYRLMTKEEVVYLITNRKQGFL